MRDASKQRLTAFCVVLFIVSCWAALASGAPGSSQTNSISGVPEGYELLAAEGSGRALFTVKQSINSAKAAVLSTLRDLAKSFDAKPAVSGAFADDKDHQCQCSFTAQRNGQLFKGMVTCGIGERGAVITVVYSLAGAPRGELANLMAALPLPVKWVVHPLPGGSGTISLPADWKLTDSNVIGSVSAAGPRGELIGLGIGAEVMTPNSFIAAQARAAGTLLVAPFSDPVTAIKNLTPQISAMSLRRGGPGIVLEKIISSTPDTSQLPNGRAAWIYCTITMTTGSKVEHLREWTRFECYPLGAMGWAFYSSYAAVPDAIFDRELPLLIQIGKSWNLNDRAVQSNTTQLINAQNQRFAAFEKSMQERNQSFDRFLQSAQNAERVREKCNANFDEIIRGSRTVEDTQTGEHRQVDLGYSKEIVDKLNQNAGYDRYKEIPLRDQF